jgi:ubiquinone/menaquinone biosynthesis C-methylase UbiE
VTETSIGPGLSTGHPQNVAYRLDKVARHRAIGGHWLDCGGFDGHYANGLLERGASAVTISDVDAERVREAEGLWSGDPRFSFAACPAERMPFADASFDGVLLNEVLEHVRDERESLAEVRRVLKPGGVLALFSPNRWFPFEGHGLDLRGRRFRAPAPLIPWLPKRMTRSVVKARNYWPRELRQLAVDAQLTPFEVDYALPTLNTYPWLPPRLVDSYQRNLERLDRSPLRRFGVSTLILARKDPA